MERLVADSGRWTILRDGALYGPHTGRDEMWRSQARAGELEMSGDGSDYILLVHVADLAHAFVLAAEQTQASAILSVVDDAPTTYREILTYIARLEGGPDPKRGANTPLPSFRISNARAQTLLGWRPGFQSYRSGVAWALESRSRTGEADDDSPSAGQSGGSILTLFFARSHITVTTFAISNDRQSCAIHSGK